MQRASRVTSARADASVTQRALGEVATRGAGPSSESVVSVTAGTVVVMSAVMSARPHLDRCSPAARRSSLVRLAASERALVETTTATQGTSSNPCVRRAEDDQSAPAELAWCYRAHIGTCATAGLPDSWHVRESLVRFR